MAPGRRRGAKGLKSTDELRLGDLVLAKVKGFPAWPAKVSRPEDWGKTPDPKKYFVYFFGTSEIAFVAPVDIQKFTVEAKIKLSTRCKGKPLRFTQAVKEICEELDKLQQKRLNGFEDDTSRDLLVSEGCSIDADEDDDDAMKVNMTDCNSLNKPHRIMGMKSLDGSISRLEHCSQRRGILDGKEGKPCTSGNVNGGVSPSIYGKQGTYETAGPISSKKEVVSTSSSCSDYLSKEENSRSIKVEADSASVEEPNGACRTKHEGGISPSIQLTYVRHADSEYKELIKANKLSQVMETKQSTQGMATFSERKAKKFMKGKNDDIQKNDETEYKDLNKTELSRKKINVQQGLLKQIARNNELSHTAKKSNSFDITDATAKVSAQTNKRVESDSLKDGRRSLWRGKTESCSTVGVVEFLSDDEDALPPPKRLCRAVDSPEERVRKYTAALKVEASSVDSIKSPFSVGTKRRAVRLCDDEEEEKPKTPVHAGSAKVSRGLDTTSKNGSLRAKSTAVHVMKKTLRVEDGSVKEFSSAERPVEGASPSYQKNVEKKPRITGGKNDSLSPKRVVPEKASVKDGKVALSSPKVSPEFVATFRLIPEIEKPSKGETTKPLHYNSQKKLPTSTDVVSGIGESSSTPLIKQIGERSKHNSISERKKAIPKSSSHGTDGLEFGGFSGNGSVLGESLELSRTDKIISFDDSKISDPVTSMKHLIAAAQAKKRESHLRNVNSNVFFATGTHAAEEKSSLSSVSPIPPLGFSNMLRPDPLGLQAHSVSPSLASDVQRLSITIQHETEQCEEKKLESGNFATEGSLSGGTEAAVARDAFEGMIETLSRTKESIGRATRLAIDCAKYGIASEVVELLIRKLQSENSMHRKVDLFFLVDSITQCSHNHKGIAGASYIPIVQAALSRLLGAAAPPGAAACENRRQCLKVLRLWQERQILPEAFLQPFMNEIGVTNDETSSGLSLRRPSRVQRAFDDPIREMEGVLVDEYGSNSTFQFLSTHAFGDNDDDDDANEIIPTIFYKEVSERSLGEHSPVSIDDENQSVTPNERRHCILEDVDGELEMEDVSVPLKDEMEDVSVSLKYEMEDVSVPLKDERYSYACATTEVAASDMYLEMSSNNSELPPLPEGSPPLPPNSPPQTPPLPFSPPPVLPQLQTTVPVPAPFLSQANPFPLPPVGSSPSGLLSQQPLLSQPSSAPQCFQPFPPISSSPSVYQHQPSINGSSLPAHGNQLTQIVAPAQGLRGDPPGRSDVYGQFRFVPLEAGNPHEPSLCNTSRPVEYSQIDAYGNPLSSQSNQQFQLPFTQTPLHPNAATQNQLNHLGYGNTSAQMLYQQHPYPHSFSLPNLPDAPKLYVADDQWRLTPIEFNNDHQSISWMARGRSSLGAPFSHEDFSRPQPGRPPTNTFSFQPPRHSTLPAGSSSSGRLMSGQVEMHAHNWRPM